jgi:hypothetical protein
MVKTHCQKRNGLCADMLPDPGHRQQGEIDNIGKRAMTNGRGNVRKTMSAITKQLDELGWEAEKHKRDSPGPS